jgi:hypothetical protein
MVDQCAREMLDSCKSSGMKLKRSGLLDTACKTEVLEDEGVLDATPTEAQ